MSQTLPARHPRFWVAAFIAIAAITLWQLPGAFAQDMRDIIHYEALDNGLEVIVIPDSSVPIVTIELTVKNGAYTETEELNGLSHLYEHMFFKGNAVIPNQEAYLQRMRELGIVFNGTTSTERVNYFFTLPTDNLAEGLEFMYDATVSPLFSEEEFEAEKQVVLGEADRAESNPYYWLRKGINDLLWYEYPARKDPLGARETVLAATIEQMEWMKEHYYVPNNSVILVAGDVEPEAAVAAVNAQFGQWEPGEDPFETYPVPEHPPLEESAFTIVEESVQVPAFQIAWHGPSVDEDPEATHAADVLLYILRQSGSQFQQNLVESRLALSASKSYYTQRHIGPISVTVRTGPDNLRDAIRETLREVYQLADPDYFTDEELEAAKTILTVNETYNREKTSDFIHSLSFWWAVSGLDYYLDFNEDIRGVTQEDIADYVEEYILDEHFVLGVMLSEEQREQLELTEEELAELVDEVLEEIEQEDDEPTAHNDSDDEGRR